MRFCTGSAVGRPSCFSPSGGVDGPGYRGAGALSASALSADTVRQFYEQAEIDYEELAELIAELDMAGPMKALLTPYGEKAEALLRLLP